MTIFDRAISLFRKKEAPISYGAFGAFGGINYLSGQTRGGLEQILRLYGESPWLYAAVTRRAEAVAEVKWHLNKVKESGETEEIPKHEIIDLLAKPNPHQTGADLLELMEKFELLTGKAYLAKQVNKGKKELWLLPSPYVFAIPDKIDFISGYRFERGGEKKIFKPEQIIPFVHTDPWNLYDGVGPAQALAIDIDIDMYQRQYNRFFFFNGAEPGTVVAYPKDSGITKEEIDRLLEQWNIEHRGYGRAHKLTILTAGATVTPAGIGHRDMDFVNLAKWGRDVQLGGLGLPGTILGVAENANRAIAQTAEYMFARWSVRTSLEFYCRKFNEFLIPEWKDESLVLTYDDPTPEDAELKIKQTVELTRAGIITRNEARAEHGYDPDPTPAGDEYLPQSASAGLANVPVAPSEQGTSGKGYSGDPKVKSLFRDDAAKEEYWKGFAKRTESYEKPLVKALQAIFDVAKAETAESVKGGSRINLFSRSGLREDYLAKGTPLVQAALEDAIKQGRDLVPPKNPHKADPIPPLISQHALEWLKTRMSWAAAEIGDTLERDLTAELLAGFEAGESMEQIARRLDEFFGDTARANRIARTEIISASNFGAVEGYKEQGVQKTEWYTAQDERTCELCDSLNHQENFVGEGFIPPAHP